MQADMESRICKQCLSNIYNILLTTSYRAKATHDFLQNVVPDFISAEECPTHS